jgi:hypothetical protein
MHLVNYMFITENSIGIKTEAINEFVLHVAFLNFITWLVDLPLLKGYCLFNLFLCDSILFAEVLMSYEAS